MPSGPSQPRSSGQIIVCGQCGELYRRVHWNNHGCKSIVWRCISRLEPSRAAMNCTSRTIKEDLLQEVTVKLHVRNLCRKLETKNRTQIAVRLAQLGQFN